MKNKYLTMKDTNGYINELQKIVDNYNNSYHSTIKSTPEKPNEEVIKSMFNRKNMKAKKVVEEQTFDINDKVRF